MTDQDATTWTSRLPILDLRESWANIPEDRKVRAFLGLDQGESDDFFLSLSHEDQAELILNLPESHRRHWVRLLAPDDMTDVLQAMPASSSA